MPWQFRLTSRTPGQTDLILSVTKNINNSEFTILLILIILFTTIFFCHGLIRLCMFIVRPKPDDDGRTRLPDMLGPGGYAVPRRPIRVVLARDEEAAGMESETTKMQPPAYGLWRESVVCDEQKRKSLVKCSLTGSSELTLIASIGNAMNPLQLRQIPYLVPQLPIGRRRTSPRTAWDTWLKHAQGRSRHYQTCPCLHILPKQEG
jgi:hypothetical protein